jgi:hypothetical protein
MMRSTLHRMIPNLAIALCLALLPALAQAGPFVPLPKQGKATKLQVRFVKYTGGANGKMVVDVRNPGKRSERFTAKGMYFVPDGDPERAPQRLGAAGPFETAGGDSKSSIRVKPGATVRLNLQVFCLDSHRSSPGASQGFNVARKRLPKSLQSKIEGGAHKALRKHKGDVGAANSAIQSHVWSTRNKRWIKLQGERKNEKSSRTHRQRRTNRMPQQLNIQLQNAPDVR